MIEVFKTNVYDKEQADSLADQIEDVLSHCCVNFDLEDCDRILRVKGITGESDICQVIGLVKSYGYHVEILPDDDPGFGEEELSGEVNMELSDTYA